MEKEEQTSTSHEVPWWQVRKQTYSSGGAILAPLFVAPGGSQLPHRDPSRGLLLSSRRLLFLKSPQAKLVHSPRQNESRMC